MTKTKPSSLFDPCFDGGSILKWILKDNRPMPEESSEITLTIDEDQTRSELDKFQEKMNLYVKLPFPDFVNDEGKLRELGFNLPSK